MRYSDKTGFRSCGQLAIGEAVDRDFPVSRTEAGIWDPNKSFRPRRTGDENYTRSC
jgi:hypothetical protein